MHEKTKDERLMQYLVMERKRGELFSQLREKNSSHMHAASIGCLPRVQREQNSTVPYSCASTLTEHNSPDTGICRFAVAVERMCVLNFTHA